MLDSSSSSSELIYLQSWFTTDASIPAQKHCDNTSAVDDHRVVRGSGFLINVSLTKCLIVSKNTFIKSKLWLLPRFNFKSKVNSKHHFIIYSVLLIIEKYLRSFCEQYSSIAMDNTDNIISSQVTKV